MRTTKAGYEIKSTSDRHAYINLRPTLDDLAGREAQNGICVPASGREIVHPSGIITPRAAREIGQLKSVLPTLRFGARMDSPIVQVF